MSSQAGQANALPPAQGKGGGPGAHHGHRRPSHGGAPSAARPSQAIRAKPGSGALRRPENSPYFPLQQLPQPGIPGGAPHLARTELLTDGMSPNMAGGPERREERREGGLGGCRADKVLGVSQGERELGGRTARFNSCLRCFLALWPQAIHNFSESQFHHLYNGNKGHKTHLTGLL